MINLRRYQYVTTIAECRSFSKAAQQLHVAQPSLSRYVNKLEAELGTTLFDRSKIPLELTHAGRRYMHYISAFKSMEDRMRREFTSMAETKTHRFHISALPFLGTYILPRIVPYFAERCPNVEINVMEHNSCAYEKALLAGQVDVFFSNLPPRNRELAYRKIAPDRMLLVAMRTELLERRFDLTENSMKKPLQIELASLQEENFVVLQPWQNMRSMAEEIFRRAAFTPSSHSVAPSIPAALSLIGCNPSFTFACESALLYVKPNFPLAFFSAKDMEDFASYTLIYKAGLRNEFIDVFGNCVEYFFRQAV